MFGKAIVRGVLAVAMVLATSFAQGGDHATWPTDWNNWSDPALWVTVGNPGNAGEWSGESYGGVGPDRICGAVDYNYQIGRYEVTAGQYTEFLNHKAATDPYGLYNTSMMSEIASKIQRSGTSGSYTYSVASDYANRPVHHVSFWDAARFTNWLHNDQGNGDTETGAYTLNGYNGDDGRSITRNLGAKWFLPSEDEWYKAAYHENDGVTGNYFDYPTGVNTPVPGRDMTELTNPGNNANYSPFRIDPPYFTTLAGEFQLSDSPYGTFDQGGNVWEWNEAVVYELEGVSTRGLRGGSLIFNSDYLSAPYRHDITPTFESNSYAVGFRVASVPEPGSIILLVCGAIAGLIWWGRRK